MIRDLPKILFFCACAILLGVGLAKYAKADGYEPGMRGYKDGGPAAYSYSHRPYSSPKKRYVAKCDRHMSAYECRRFREVMAKRAARSRDYDRPVRRRYAEANYVRSDADYRGGRVCKPAIKATSKPTLTMKGAEKEAKRNWSMNVEEAYSGAYNDVRNARVISLNCKPIHYGAWRSMCTFIARPCRED
jgi:hypothetical protein